MISGRNNQSPCLGQSKPFPYMMPPQSSSHPQYRTFQSSSSYQWSGKGNKLNGKPTPPPSQPCNYFHHYTPPPQRSQPARQGGLLSGLRDCMNRFIPHSNFSSKFSQKPKDMRDYPVILQQLPLHMTQPQTNMHTIITVTSPIMEMDVGAVMTSLFSAEDFPALSTPKPVPSVKQLWEEESKKREKKKSCKPTRQKEKSARHNSTCDLESDNENGFLFIDFDCTKLHFISFSPPKHLTPPSASKSPSSNRMETPFPDHCQGMRQRQMSECSDDSFVVCFTDDCADGVLGFSSDDSDSDDDSSVTEGPDIEAESSDDDEDTVDGDMKKTDPFVVAVCDNQLDSGFEESGFKKRVSFFLLIFVLLGVIVFFYCETRR